MQQKSALAGPDFLQFSESETQWPPLFTFVSAGHVGLFMYMLHVTRYLQCKFMYSDK